MITQLSIENFKSFDGLHELPFSPITLIYGPNSAGKSSLIQSLALLKQSLVSSSRLRDDPELVFRGDYVDLGSFLATVNSHDRSRGIGIGLGFVDPAPGADAGALADEAVFAGLRFVADSRGRPRQQLAELGDSDDSVRFVRAEDRGFVLDRAEDKRQLLRLIRSRGQIHEDSGDRVSAKNLRDLAEAVSTAFEAGSPKFLGAGLFPAIPVPGFLENREFDMMLGIWFEEYLHARARVVLEVLDRLAYLGPLRSLPARFQVLGGQEVDDVGFTGEHTTQLLASRPDLLRKVNTALEDLEVSYKLDVLKLSPSDAEKLGSVEEKRLGTPSPASESQLEIGELVTTQLVHRSSGVAVTPRDVGFGISQMLPVVVQLLVNERSTVCVEQPEVHIHPRLQARLAEILIESTHADGPANQVVVETHSEALMLRIQRRIAEGNLDPSAVQVLYVGDAGGKAEVTTLQLNRAGHFLDEWPDGFFAERRDDLFKRSAAIHASLAADDDDGDDEEIPVEDVE